MKARIYKPSKSAMQSGLAGTKGWVLDYMPQGPSRRDPLTGWQGSMSAREQVRLHFHSREEAIAYASREGIDYFVDAEHDKPPETMRSYADNVLRRYRYS
ncbi:MAG: ETC complex I subunit [Alphaproteobacteria bacterium GM202ARS2]|nr:ETC complex I subunit [Alphaproteobacteria bacterium GM202ARS2]